MKAGTSASVGRERAAAAARAVRVRWAVSRCAHSRARRDPAEATRPAGAAVEGERHPAPPRAATRRAAGTSERRRRRTRAPRARPGRATGRRRSPAARARTDKEAERVHERQRDREPVQGRSGRLLEQQGDRERPPARRREGREDVAGHTIEQIRERGERGRRLGRGRARGSDAEPPLPRSLDAEAPHRRLSDPGLTFDDEGRGTLSASRTASSSSFARRPLHAEIVLRGARST